MELAESVLIDDSFRERAQAAARGVITLDCDMVEMLLDERS
jgi:hypothetical protein